MTRCLVCFVLNCLLIAILCTFTDMLKSAIFYWCTFEFDILYNSKDGFRVVTSFVPVREYVMRKPISDFMRTKC